MTLDPIRDEIAALLGWSVTEYGGVRVWSRNGDNTDDHPVPASLDGISSLWPVGRTLSLAQRPDGTTEAFTSINCESGTAVVAPTLLEAWANLLLAVLRHEKEAKR
jgi:hypothetical protein